MSAITTSNGRFPDSSITISEINIFRFIYRYIILISTKLPNYFRYNKASQLAIGGLRALILYADARADSNVKKWAFCLAEIMRRNLVHKLTCHVPSSKLYIQTHLMSLLHYLKVLSRHRLQLPPKRVQVKKALQKCLPRI